MYIIRAFVNFVNNIILCFFFFKAYVTFIVLCSSGTFVVGGEI